MRSGTELDGPVDSRFRDHAVGYRVKRVAGSINDSTPVRVEPEVENGSEPKVKEMVKKEQLYVPHPPYKPPITYP